jgi:hypothetical protein
MTNAFFRQIGVVGLLIGCGTGRAAETGAYVSKTFQDLVGRVTVRDETTGAIRQVKAREDSPHHPRDLAFSMEWESSDDTVVVVSLTWRTRTGNHVDERYRLKIDDAIREERMRREHRRKVQEANDFKEAKRQKEAVEQLTGGRLWFRMRPEEVEAVKGEPIKIEHRGAAAGSFAWTYPDMVVTFSGRMLLSVSITENANQRAGGKGGSR